MKSRHLLIGLMSTVAAGALASAALADPTARVGRVAEIDGGVSLLPPQTDTWSWASRNYPVAPGESFWTGDDGRVQLQIGLTEARLDSETELDVVDLDYGEMRLALPQGSADIRLWGSPRGGVTISTPAGDVRLDGRGLYRIDVSAPPQDGSYPTVEVTVFEGRAEAPAPEGRSSVQAGQAAVLYAGYEPQLQDAQDASIDDWGADLVPARRAL
jgi:ferric-dicitrate binding protein FerR (iron transport regulator)